MAAALLAEVGADLGRTPGDVQPIIVRIVHEHWFDTVESLSEITDRQFAEWGVPVRFVQRLRQRLGTAPAVAGAVVAGPDFVSPGSKSQPTSSQGALPER